MNNNTDFEGVPPFELGDVLRSSIVPVLASSRQMHGLSAQVGAVLHGRSRGLWAISGYRCVCVPVFRHGRWPVILSY